MTGLEVYKIYVALKNHFRSPTYDYFKFGGKTTASQTSLDKRNDKAFFYSIAKKYPTSKEVEQFFVANFIENSNKWIGVFLEDDAIQTYNQWKKRIHSLTYQVKEDISVLKNAPTGDWGSPDVGGTSLPYIIMEYRRGNICIETLIILDALYAPFFLGYNSHPTMKDLPPWKELYRICTRYHPFLEYNTSSMKKLIQGELP